MRDYVRILIFCIIIMCRYYLDNLHKICNLRQRPHNKVLISITTCDRDYIVHTLYKNSLGLVQLILSVLILLF